jgi:hypothetical protein
LQLALDGRFRLFVFLVVREFQIPYELIDLVNTLQNVPEMPSGSLKGNNRLPQNLILNRFFQPFRRRQIDLCAEQIGEAVFEPPMVRRV